MPTRRYGSRTLEVGNLDKVLYPDDGITKGDVIDYYEAVADAMLPELRDRPLTLHRFPDGIARGGFYQKRAADYFPEWLRTAEVPMEGGTIRHPLAADRASLVYLADLATLTFHPWLSRIDRPRQPDRVILDLDPPGDDFEPVRRAALQARDLLEEIGLVPFARTTGSKGLHVVAPIRRAADFDEVRVFGAQLAEALQQADPGALTTEVRKAKREGRVFVDHLRNRYAQTAVASYSLRARPGAPVAMPLDWAEVADPAIGPRSFDIRSARSRVEQGIDPWQGFSRRARSIEAPRRRLEAMLNPGRSP